MTYFNLKLAQWASEPPRQTCGPTERWNRPVGPLGQPIPLIQGARARSIPMWQAGYRPH